MSELVKTYVTAFKTAASQRIGYFSSKNTENYFSLLLTYSYESFKQTVFWELLSSGLLRREYWWILTYVSRQLICPIFKGQNSWMPGPLRWDR